MACPRAVSPGTRGRAAVNRPVCSALMRQGRAVARAEGPRHRRPRLRHETHRRGEASAASGPRKARARVVTKGRQSAQPPADRSVRRLLQRRHWTAPAHRWAARRRSGPPSARQRARTAAAPCLHRSAPRGTVGSTGAAALCPCSCFLSPLHPLTGALRTATALAWRRLCRSCRFLWRLCHAALGFLSTWASACDGAQGRSACIGPSAIFPPFLQAFVM
jgi:hypothetical protein